jgi:hypothetical protein
MSGYERQRSVTSVADELLFTVVGPAAVPAEPIGLVDAGLKERADLQEWVIAYPEILGSGVKVVTFEFDRWWSSSGPGPQDRLDILGLDADGRLVVAELKRDKAPDTTEMQAIKYAAMASRFTVESLAEQYARFRTGRGLSTSTDEALAELQAHAPELSLKSLRQPRIVLLAREYPMVVTASAVWLSEIGLDITLVQFKAYRATATDSHGDSHTQVLISVSQLYPVRDVEEFMISPQRLQALEAKGQLWDKESYIQAARDRFSEAEVAFIQQLLDDVDSRGIRHGWGRWATPGVSGHYLVAGIDTTVWIMNLSKASLELRLLWIAKSLKEGGQDFSRLEKAAELLSRIAGTKLEGAANKEWKASVFLPLADIIPDHIQDVVSAIGAIIDPIDAGYVA